MQQIVQRRRQEQPSSSNTISIAPSSGGGVSSSVTHPSPSPVPSPPEPSLPEVTTGRSGTITWYEPGVGYHTVGVQDVGLLSSFQEQLQREHPGSSITRVETTGGGRAIPPVIEGGRVISPATTENIIVAERVMQQPQADRRMALAQTMATMPGYLGEAGRRQLIYEQGLSPEYRGWRTAFEVGGMQHYPESQLRQIYETTKLPVESFSLVGLQNIYDIHERTIAGYEKITGLSYPSEEKTRIASERSKIADYIEQGYELREGKLYEPSPESIIRKEYESMDIGPRFVRTQLASMLSFPEVVSKGIADFIGGKPLPKYYGVEYGSNLLPSEQVMTWEYQFKGIDPFEKFKNVQRGWYEYVIVPLATAGAFKYIQELRMGYEAAQATKAAAAIRTFETGAAVAGTSTIASMGTSAAMEEFYLGRAPGATPQFAVSTMAQLGMMGIGLKSEYSLFGRPVESIARVRGFVYEKYPGIRSTMFEIKEFQRVGAARNEIAWMRLEQKISSVREAYAWSDISYAFKPMIYEYEPDVLRLFKEFREAGVARQEMRAYRLDYRMGLAKEAFTERIGKMRENLIQNLYIREMGFATKNKLFDIKESLFGFKEEPSEPFKGFSEKTQKQTKIQRYIQGSFLIDEYGVIQLEKTPQLRGMKSLFEKTVKQPSEHVRITDVTEQQIMKFEEESILAEWILRNWNLRGSIDESMPSGLDFFKQTKLFQKEISPMKNFEPELPKGAERYGYSRMSLAEEKTLADKYTDINQKAIDTLMKWSGKTDIGDISVMRTKAIVPKQTYLKDIDWIGMKPSSEVIKGMKMKSFKFTTETPKVSVERAPTSSKGLFLETEKYEYGPSLKYGKTVMRGLTQEETDLWNFLEKAERGVYQIPNVNIRGSFDFTIRERQVGKQEINILGGKSIIDVISGYGELSGGKQGGREVQDFFVGQIFWQPSMSRELQGEKLEQMSMQDLGLMQESILEQVSIGKTRYDYTYEEDIVPFIPKIPGDDTLSWLTGYKTSRKARKMGIRKRTHPVRFLWW